MIGFKKKPKVTASADTNQDVVKNIESTLLNRGKKNLKSNPKEISQEQSPVKEEMPQEKINTFTFTKPLVYTNTCDGYFIGLANLASREPLDPYIDIGEEDPLLEEESLIIRRATNNYGMTQDVPSDIIEEPNIIQVQPNSNTINKKGLKVDLV